MRRSRYDLVPIVFMSSVTVGSAETMGLNQESYTLSSSSDIHLALCTARTNTMRSENTERSMSRWLSVPFRRLSCSCGAAVQIPDSAVFSVFSSLFSVQQSFACTILPPLTWDAHAEAWQWPQQAACAGGPGHLRSRV